MHACRSTLEDPTCIREHRFEDARTAWEELGEARFADPFLVEIGANIHAQLGRFDEEIELWAKLCTMLPTDARIARCHATALMERGRGEEAIIALEAFSAETQDVETLCLLASVLENLGRFADALQAVGRARALDPENPPVGALHACLLARNGQLAWARAIAGTVDRTQPSDNVTCRELARAYRYLRDFDKAIHWYTRALEADTSDMQTAVSLASTYDQARHPDVARRMAMAALEYQPDLLGMHRLLVRLDHDEGHLDQARARAEDMLTFDLSEVRRRSVLLELALIEQQSGNWGEAYRRAQQGNALARETFGKLGHRLGGFNDLIQRVIDYRAVRLAPPRTEDRPAPVFMVGIPRSGTTLAQQMLQAHPDIETLDELDSGTRVLRQHLAERPGMLPYPDHLEQFDDHDWQELRRRYWADVDGAGTPESPVLVDKLPMALVRMHYLARLFPDAKMIVVLRDPRDSLWSNYLQDYEPNAFTMECTELASTTRLIDLTLRLWLQWRENPPLPAIELFYEDLVRDPGATIRPVLEHVGVGWDDAVLRYHELAATRAIKTPSYRDVSKPVYRTAMGRWRHVEPFLATHFRELERVATALGYEPLVPPEPDLVA